MKRFYVELRIVSEHFTTVTVKARDEDEAEDKARQIAFKRKLKWDDCGFDWESLIALEVEHG